MGELKEKTVLPGAKRPAVAGRAVKVVSGVVRSRSFGTLTAEQEALYGSISANTDNTMDAAAARAAKHANRK
jgi:hypothetical protein